VEVFEIGPVKNGVLRALGVVEIQMNVFLLLVLIHLGQVNRGHRHQDLVQLGLLLVLVERRRRVLPLLAVLRLLKVVCLVAFVCGHTCLFRRDAWLYRIEVLAGLVGFGYLSFGVLLLSAFR